MNILQIVAFAVFCGIISIYIKSSYPEMFSLTVIASGIILLIMVSEYLITGISFIKNVCVGSGIGDSTLKILIKTVAISYVVEFGTGIVEDLGIKSLSDKITLAGKIIIFCLAIPIFKSIFEIIVGFMK